MAFLNTRPLVKSTFWHLVHNLIAHPLMALPTSLKWVDKFHDWTAKKAYSFPYLETEEYQVTVSC